MESRPRRRRAGLGSIAGALIGCLTLSGTVSAGTWDAAVQLRYAPHVVLEDMVTSNIIAVGWSELDSLWVKVSRDSGALFGPRFRFAVDPARRAASLSLAMGGTDIWGAWVEDRSNSNYQSRWRVMLGRRSISGGAVTAQLAVPNLRQAQHPDLGFVGHRVWIAFQEPGGTPTRNQVRVWHSLSSNPGASSALVTLGDAPSTRGSAQLYSDYYGAAVTWSSPDGIRFRSASMSFQSGYPVTWNAPQLLSPSGTFPIIDGAGDRLVVAWHHQGDLWVRHSVDRGATWAAPQRLHDGTPSDAWRPIDMDVGGQQVVLMARALGDGGNSSWRLRSGTGGATWEDPEFVRANDHRLARFFADEVGYVKLCEVWTNLTTGTQPKYLLWRRQE